MTSRTRKTAFITALLALALSLALGACRKDKQEPAEQRLEDTPLPAQPRATEPETGEMTGDWQYDDDVDMASEKDEIGTAATGTGRPVVQPGPAATTPSPSPTPPAAPSPPPPAPAPAPAPVETWEDAPAEPRYEAPEEPRFEDPAPYYDDDFREESDDIYKYEYDYDYTYDDAYEEPKYNEGYEEGYDEY